MPRQKWGSLCLLLLTLMVGGCQCGKGWLPSDGEGPQDAQPQPDKPAESPNQPPKAHILSTTPSLSFVGHPIILTGKGSSDPEQGKLAYEWSIYHQPVGSNASITPTPNEPSQATFTGTVAGTYVIRLVVKDPQGATGQSEFSVQHMEPYTPWLPKKILATKGTKLSLLFRTKAELTNAFQRTWRIRQQPPQSQEKIKNNSILLDQTGQYLLERVLSSPIGTITQTLPVEVILREEVETHPIRLEDADSLNVDEDTYVRVEGKRFVYGTLGSIDGKELKTFYESPNSLLLRTNNKHFKEGTHTLSLWTFDRQQVGQTTFKIQPPQTPTLFQVTPNEVTVGEFTWITISGRHLVPGRLKPAVVGGILEWQNTTTLQGLLKWRLPAGIHALSLHAPVYIKKLASGLFLKVKPIPYSFAIQSHTLTPESRYREVPHTHLRLHAVGLKEDTQVLVNNTLITDRKITITGPDGKGTIDFPSFGQWKHEHEVFNVRLQHLNTTSRVDAPLYGFGLSPIAMQTNGVAFYRNKYDAPTNTGLVGLTYDLVVFRGTRLLPEAELYIDGVQYTGPVEKNSNGFGIAQFDTTPLAEGQHSFHFQATIGGKTFKSQVGTFEIKETRVASVKEIVTTRTGSRISSTKEYELIVRGEQFAQQLEVEINGQLAPLSLTNINPHEFSIKAFNARTYGPGSHSFVVTNLIDGKRFKSKPYSLIIIDGRVPIVKAITPSGPYTNSVLKVSIQGLEFLPGAGVIIDGKPYTGTVDVNSSSVITIPALDVNGYQPGPHTIQVVNTYEGREFKSNTETFQLNPPPKPTLIEVTPSYVLKGQQREFRFRFSGSWGGYYLTMGGETFLPSREENGVLYVTTDASQLAPGNYKWSLYNKYKAKSDTELPCKVYPTFAPVIQSLSPSVWSATAPLDQADTRTLLIRGSRLTATTEVLLDQKVIGTLTNATIDQAHFDLPVNLLSQPGTHSLQVRDANGSSNSLVLRVVGAQKPELLTVTPKMIGTTTSTIKVEGRGFAPGSTILANNIKLPTIYTTQQTPIKPGVLQAALTNAQRAALKGLIKIEVQHPSKGKSSPYLIAGPTHQPAFNNTSSLPFQVELNVLGTQGIVLNGRFTKSAKLYLDGVEQTSCMHLLAGRMTCQWNPPKQGADGSYHYWQLKDGNSEGNMAATAYLAQGNKVIRVEPPYINKQQTQVLLIQLSHGLQVPSGPNTPTVEIFGKSYRVSLQKNGQEVLTTIQAKDLQQQVPGLHTGQIKDTKGQLQATFVVRLFQ